MNRRLLVTQKVVPVKKKRTYKTVDVHRVDVTEVTAQIVDLVVVAIDVAKHAMVAGLADRAGDTKTLVRFEHPRSTLAFLALLEELRRVGRDVQVVMEPTGVYGESLRYQLELRGFPVFRVDPKRVHDFAYVVDGVQSHHDAKSCAVIARLHAQGVSRRWRVRSELEKQARVLVDEHAMLDEPLEQMLGRLEALTAMHWPELNELIDQRTSWFLHLLAEHPSPRDVAARPDDVRTMLRAFTRGMLSADKIETVVTSASRTLGAPIDEPSRGLLQRIAQRAIELREQIGVIEKQMTQTCASDPMLSRVASVVGQAAALAIYADVGDPASFESAAALEKACGLNLRERSSGQHQGKLKITKRGPARVRRYLYLAALRALQHHALVRRWYERRTAYRGDMKRKAVVAVMRKLLRALVHVARGHAFDATKLFDVRALERGDGSPERTHSAAHGRLARAPAASSAS